MREIEFRAFWRGKMHEVGQLCRPMNGKPMTVFSREYVNMGNVPLMQYTGVRDVKGEKIFEGDVLSVVGYYSGEKVHNLGPERLTGIYEIVFNGGSFGARRPCDNPPEDFEILTLGFALLIASQKQLQFEIIGNIYENEEMFLRLRPGELGEQTAHQNTD